MRKLNYEILM